MRVQWAGQTISPRVHVKILGVIMDAKRKYREHIARAASIGLEVAMTLRRLKGLSLSTARQLFTSTVVLIMDYASSIWMHVFKDQLRGPINRVQGTGVQAIIGAFSNVVTNTSRMQKFRKQHHSTLYQVADALEDIAMEKLQPVHLNALGDQSAHRR